VSCHLGVACKRWCKDMDDDDDDDVQIVEAAPEEQASVVQLASLLEIDIALAHKALQYSQWNFEAAVDAACQLASTSSEASAGAVQLRVGSSSASASSRPASSSSNESHVPPVPSPGLSRRTHPPFRNSTSSAASAGPAQLRVGHSSASSSSRPSSSSHESHIPAVPNPGNHRRTHSSLADDVPDVFISAAGPADKKRRLEATSTAATFKIPNNDADEPAANPPMFKAHPLREEQRRSLGWMISREAVTHTSADDRFMLVKGGLLADRMGYGKTSTTIGLVSLDVDRALRQPGQQGVPLLQKDCYIPSDSTLIVCPSHLIDQWESEFWKFLGHSGVQISRPQPLDSTNINQCTLTHKFEDSSRSRWQCGIRVGKRPSSWKVGGAALVTDIDHSTLRQFAESFGAEGAICCGDLISKIECKNLIADDGERVASKAVSGIGDIHRFFRGELQSCRRVQRGFLPAVDGQPPRPNWTNQYFNLRFAKDSTVKFHVSRINNRQRTRVERGNGPLKVLTIRSVEDIELLQQQDFVSQFHVILSSAGVQSSLRYAEHIKEASGASGLMETKLAALGERMKTWCRNRTARKTFARRSIALFEVVFWRRVILDEFHESEAWEYRVREMLRSLGAIHKWGLSGTPPLKNAAAVAEVAGLLGYTVPCKNGNVVAQSLHYGSSVMCSHNATKEFFANESKQRALYEIAEKFVEEHIRQNTSDLVEQIGIAQHEELVDHTPEERLIYRQACHDQGIFDLAAGYSQISLAAREELLKRCAHFDMGQAAESASSAVDGLGAQKREWVNKVENQLWVEVARARVFHVWDSKGKEALRTAKVVHPKTKELIECILASSVEGVGSKLSAIAPPAESVNPGLGMLKQAMQVEVKLLQQDGSFRLRPEVRLIQPIGEKEYYKDDHHRHAVVHAVAKWAGDRDANDALSAQAICERACLVPLHLALSRGLSELASLLDKAHRSLEFYTQQLSNLTREGVGIENKCSICLEDTSDIASMAILPCSHVFHSECIRAALAINAFCPECRTPVAMSHVSSVVMELKPPEPQAVETAGPSISMSPAWKQNGSKLNAVANRLRQIRENDPTAKALVFVQWADLEAKVWRALHDHHIPFLGLSGDSRCRVRLGGEDGAVLKKFQEDDTRDAPFVLVLSLQRAAAGTNLTSASHVLFVHPMNADTVHSAAAYERQALARVRRIGQARNQVHVWRFVTRHTVEEHIWKLHRDAPEDAEAARAVAELASES